MHEGPTRWSKINRFDAIPSLDRLTHGQKSMTRDKNNKAQFKTAKNVLKEADKERISRNFTNSSTITWFRNFCGYLGNPTATGPEKVQNRSEANYPQSDATRCGCRSI